MVRQSVPTDEPEDKVLAQLSAQPTHIDEIVRGVGLPAATVSGLLTILEMKGLVRQVAAMTFVRAG
jgi:predicted Rossmann fold nucleotide-binding protein DprA/Smf involved in DNA uptake